MSENNVAPPWWEALTEIRERGIRMEATLDQVKDKVFDIEPRVTSLEMDRTVMRGEMTAVKARALALENDKEARDISPGQWKSWQAKVDGAVSKVLNGELVSATTASLRKEDWAKISILIGLAFSFTNIMVRFL